MKLTRHRIFSWILPLLGVALVGWYYAEGSGRDKRPAEQAALQPVTTAFLPTHENGGWGYIIYVNGKKFIHQDRIPGIPGKQPFLSEEDAVKVANLVEKKIKAGLPLPAVSIEEMQALGVQGLSGLGPVAPQ